MTEQKKRVLISVLLVSSALLLLLLGVFYLITKSFVLDAILHIYINLFLSMLVIKAVAKSFQNQIAEAKMKKTLLLCGIILFVDLVVLDAVRYILSRGVFTVLFLPTCIPLCFMVLMHHAKESNGTEITEIRKKAYWIGIPLLLLSLYFEVLSFM